MPSLFKPSPLRIAFYDHTNKSIQLSDDIDETDSPYKIPEHLRSINEQAAEVLRRKDKHTEKKLKA